MNPEKMRIMGIMGFAKEMELVSLGKCPFCKKDIFDDSFKDALSIREYQISGLCQECQDSMFTTMEGDDQAERKTKQKGINDYRVYTAMGCTQ